MNNNIRIFVALCDVSVNSIVAWSEVTAGAADTFDNTTESVADLFANKHPLSGRMLILHNGYYSEFVKRGDSAPVEFVASVKREFSDYRII